MTSSADLIRIADADFGFGALPVLRGVNFSVRESEIHAVVGKHRAGKTSLGQLLNGDRTRLAGAVYPGEHRLDGYTRRKAASLGIQMVYQGVELNSAFTVAENLFFGNQQVVIGSAFRRIKRRGLEALARDYLSGVGFNLDPSLPARDLTPADQALISVLRRLPIRSRACSSSTRRWSGFPPRTRKGSRRFFRDLTAAGSAIVFITHRIDDIYQLADRVSILRDGERFLRRTSRTSTRSTC